MDVTDLDAIGAWLVERGLAGASETELMQGLCERANRAGLGLSRGVAIIDTLHPTFEGRAVRWRNDGIEETPSSNTAAPTRARRPPRGSGTSSTTC